MMNEIVIVHKVLEYKKIKIAIERFEIHRNMNSNKK